jgi:hypothetical protein
MQTILVDFLQNQGSVSFLKTKIKTLTPAFAGAILPRASITLVVTNHESKAGNDRIG